MNLSWHSLSGFVSSVGNSFNVTDSVSIIVIVDFRSIYSSSGMALRLDLTLFWVTIYLFFKDSFSYIWSYRSGELNRLRVVISYYSLSILAWCSYISIVYLFLSSALVFNDLLYLTAFIKGLRVLMWCFSRSLRISWFVILSSTFIVLNMSSVCTLPTNVGINSYTTIERAANIMYFGSRFKSGIFIIISMASLIFLSWFTSLGSLLFSLILNCLVWPIYLNSSLIVISFICYDTIIFITISIIDWLYGNMFRIPIFGYST
jgi:hypothetical protein